MIAALRHSVLVAIIFEVVILSILALPVSAVDFLLKLKLPALRSKAFSIKLEPTLQLEKK